MAESQSMTTAEVVAKTLIDEHADFLREAVAMVAAQLMEAEITEEIGARRGEVSADGRPTETATATGAGRPGSARSSCWSRESELARPTSPPSSSRAGRPSRRSSRW